VHDAGAVRDVLLLQGGEEVKYGDHRQTETRYWDVAGQPVVGPYVRDFGEWRRMNVAEALTVAVDRSWSEVFNRKPHPLLDLDRGGE
jgi:hypothetical protein